MLLGLVPRWRPLGGLPVGTTARIRLSNLFGSQSVSIADVHVALVATGSSTQSGTDRVVTFGGSGSVTIRAGAEGNNEFVAMTISSLSELAGCFYLPYSYTLQTYQPLGTP